VASGHELSLVAPRFQFCHLRIAGMARRAVSGAVP
jgi:hypothetical protein